MGRQKKIKFQKFHQNLEDFKRKSLNY